MKKMNMIRKALLLLVPVTLSCTVLMAQSDGRKSQQNTAASKELKAKYEANGIPFNAKEVQPGSNPSARACVKNPVNKPAAIKRSTYNNLSERGREFVKSHPEKFTIVD